ncbi:hypothetical protein FA15DRAFT_273840 [Coprinopsis marcescibilis]|uniref:F-box domain-containing protein n=1 Tax=Coprinopsis marcescibilis TaxID=230819 RepID=A0A5C3KEQ2_COPMA|nr:hypothetical protein FA15DRAFT_273840 [Coprinopsis marcescibilis]
MITRSAARKAKSGIPTPTYPTAHFLSLAPELIYRIGDEAELEDLLALRLACKSCAALLRWIVYRSLTIDIKWDTYSPVLDKLELLAKTKDHPARLATKELNLKLISGTYGRRDTKVVSYERRVKALLVPALQALKNVSKLRWNNSFAKVQQVEKDVLGGIKHIIPNLTSLEISGINIGYSNSYDNLGSLETPLEILANPRLPRLTRLAISAHGQKDPSHGPNMVFLSSLMKATTKILANSRATLQSFEFRIPFGAVAAHGSFPPTFQTLFKLESVDSIVSPNSSDASVPMDSYTALTHLVIDTDFISAVRSATLTIPQLPSLQSLDIWQAYDYYPARTPEAALSTKVDIWTALINTRVRLRSLTKINISPDFLQYLSANSSGAELGKLEITCHVNMDISNSNGERETRERQRQQEMGAELFTRAIIPHRAFLESFAIWTNNSGLGHS